MTLMKAMRLEQYAPVEEHPLRMADVPTPDPGPGQVLAHAAQLGFAYHARAA